MKMSVAVSAFLVFVFSMVVDAKVLFQDDFSSGDLDKYEFSWEDKKPKEIAENAKIINSDSPKHGPKALSMEEQPHVGNLLAMIKDFEFEDGYIEMLWIDADLPEDADGPLFFRGDLGQKEVKDIYGNSILVELDTDTGLHFDVLNGGGVCAECKAGLQSAPEWTWIKVMADGKKLKLKAWLDAETEPDWMIEIENDQYKKGAVGFRSWSGTAEIAFIKITDLEGGDQAVSTQGKLATTWGGIKNFF